MIRFEDILETVQRHQPEADLEILRKAYIFSAVEHKGQLRASGEPYLVHPLGVAAILAEMRMDPVCVAVGLLHDVLEDTLTTPDRLQEYFGPDVLHIVEGVTKISKIPFATTEERQAETYRKMLLAMVDDIRVILVKLADRLHNMRTLQHLPEDRRQRISRETLDIYAPIAGRLGMAKVKNELEDVAFRYLDPAGYESLAARVEERRQQALSFVEKTRATVAEKLRAAGVEAQVEGRIKRLHSIHQKLKRQRIGLDQVYDVVGLRVLVKGVPDCYAALGVLHNTWRPVPGRIKDFVAMPRPNGYQSLHTSVISEDGHPFEVQIRTHEMHRIAEEGIAAHWKYKEGRVVEEAEDKRFTWLRQLLEWQRDLKDNREFIESVKVDLFPNEVYIFTPKGAVKQFPIGSTPIDFAYSIHSDIGNHCGGAKVNGKIVPLRYELRSGDRVEILTSPNQKPSKDWLKFVKTTRAKTKIRQWFTAEEREKSINLGKEILEKEFRKYDLQHAKLIKTGDLAKVANEFSYQGVDDLIAAVGYGKVTANQILGKMLPQERLEQQREEHEEGRLKGLIKKI